MSLRWVVMAVALTAAGATSARAASDDDLKEIRKQIQELKSTYEARIQALEERLKEAESRAAAPAPTPVAAAPMPSAATPGLSNAFNPATSVILQGRYANLSQAGTGPRGFSLSESEITMSANVDHKFGGVLTFSLSPEDTVSVEEAYGTMIAPMNGVSPKFGRFLSGIGYLNEQHQHAWDFVDAPLAYEAFLGGQYRNDGVQVRWLAPTEHYIEVGAEAGNGGALAGVEQSRNGIGSGALYVHTGGDVGLSHNWRAGLSYLRTRATDSRSETKLAIADFVWKWAPNGNARETSFKLQGEWFRQEQDALRPTGGYVQALYQFMPQWRVGARYDRLDPAGGVAPGDAIFATDATTYRPKRSSVMVDWSPSEFSRVRLQFARSQVQPDFADNQWFVQYILSLGAHGAHRY